MDDSSTANAQVSSCSVAQSALEEVQVRAVAAEEKVKRAEAALARLQAGDRTASLAAEMAQLQEGIGALRKVCWLWAFPACIWDNDELWPSDRIRMPS